MGYQPDDVTSTDGGGGGQFLPHPEGSYPAVCVDVLNLGQKVKTWQGKSSVVSSIALVFRTAELREDGTHYEVSKEFTNSMGEKASLRKFMEAWRGKPYTAEEISKGVKVSAMAGVPALINVGHKVSQAGRTYANVLSVMRLPKGVEAPDVGSYTRAPFWQTRKDEYLAQVREYARKEEEQAKRAAPSGLGDFPPALQPDEDDLPFNGER